MPTLVVAAHPDDEVLGCGGTIARLAARGESVRVLIMSDGESSRWPAVGDVPSDVVKARRTAAEEAARTLGVDSPEVLDFPDNRFDTVPMLELTKSIEQALGRFEPDTVFTHHSGDMNIDHRRVAQAVLTATRPVPGSSVKRVYAFEVLSSSHVAAPHFGSPFLPNMFVDIAETIGKKLEAMACYRGEVHPFPHPRSLDAIRFLAATRGTVCGLSSAEAFVLIREIRESP